MFKKNIDSTVDCSRDWSLRRKISQFFKNEQGVNVVEFAFAAPFLIALYVGMSNVIEMEQNSSRVGKVTSTVADIISQAPAVNSFAVENAFNAAEAMLPDASRFEMYLAGVQITDDLEPVVLWATGNRNNLSKLNLPSPGSLYNKLPSDLKKREGFIVVTHGVMSHKSVYSKDLHGKDFTKKGDNNEAGENLYEYSNYFVPRVSILTLCEACQQESD